MGAIFGLFNRDGKPVEPEILEAMNRKLLMHGPDEGGSFILGTTALGWRATWFTPEDRGDHSAVSEGLTLVLDGSLDPSDGPARMLRDFSRLDGAFAFAVHDRAENSLTIVNSPRGERSVHYVVTPRLFAFSTAPAALFTIPGVERSISLPQVAAFATGGRAAYGHTFYKNVRTMLPGHILRLSPTDFSEKPWWSVNNLPPVTFSNDDDYVEAFRRIFDDAVARLVRSASPAGIFLSGGLDSSLAAASAASLLRRNRETLRSFTQIHECPESITAFPGRYFDESPFVAALMRMYPNIEGKFIVAPPHSITYDIDRFFESAEVPMRNVFNRIWFEDFLLRARAESIRVVLTGAEGNLTASWTGAGLISEQIRSGKWLTGFREARASARRVPDHTAASIIAAELAGNLPEVLQHLGHRLWRGPNRASREMRWRLASPLRPEFLADHVKALPEVATMAGAIDRLQTFRADLLRQNYLAASIGRGHEAMFGVQLRDPYGERSIVEFCLGIPLAQYRRNGVGRWLSRRACQGRVPDMITNAESRGLQSADWQSRIVATRGELDEEFSLLQASPLAREVIDLPALRVTLRQIGETPVSQFIEPELRRRVAGGLILGRYLRWFEARQTGQ